MSLLLSCFSQLTFTYIKAHSCNNFLCTLILQALKIKFENNAIVYASIGFSWKTQKCLRFLLKAENNHHENFRKYILYNGKFIQL